MLFVTLFQYATTAVLFYSTRKNLVNVKNANKNKNNFVRSEIVNECYPLVNHKWANTSLARGFEPPIPLYLRGHSVLGVVYCCLSCFEQQQFYTDAFIFSAFSAYYAGSVCYSPNRRAQRSVGSRSGAANAERAEQTSE